MQRHRASQEATINPICRLPTFALSIYHEQGIGKEELAVFPETPE